MGFGRKFFAAVGLQDDPRTQQAETESRQAEQERQRARINEAQERARIAAVRARAGRIQTLREARVLRNELLTQATLTGVASTTSAEGALGDIRSKFGSGLSAQKFQSQVYQQISASNIAASQQAQSFLDTASIYRGRASASRESARRIGEVGSIIAGASS